MMSQYSAPAPVRRAAYAALFISIVHVIFGGIVRISGSGMGCGDNWPKCHGYWFPPFNRVDLIIEVMHRYLAFGLFVAIAVLVAVTHRHRNEAYVSGPGLVRRGALSAVAWWVAAALFGAATVFTGNPPWATAVHKLIAAALVATLAMTTIRAGGLGGDATRATLEPSRAVGSATAAAALALIVVIMGALTAKIPNAAIACAGFPLCGDGSLGGGAQHVQLTHRVLAYLLALHLVSLPFIYRKRGEIAPIRRAAIVCVALVVLQICWAAWMVTGGFPGVVRSLHQGTGMLLWAATFTMACLARRTGSRSKVGSAIAITISTPTPAGSASA